MLKALYEYAMDRELVLPPGYAHKPIKYYIHLSSEGKYLGLVPGGEISVLCPDIGSLANGKDKSNVLAEKRSVILDTESGTKCNFFRSTLGEGGKMEPALLVCRNALEDSETFTAICADADKNKVKGMDRLSFMVDGQNVLKLARVREWWNSYRLQFQNKSQEEDMTRCLITGEPTVPVATVPTVTGLAVVGGHSKGDALICFDKNAFQSYDLKQSANAPVSEEAFFTVKAGLDHLLKEAPVLAGMKFVHWYDKEIPPEKDTLMQSVGLIYLDDEEEEEEPDVPMTVSAQDKLAAEEKATRLIESVESGVTPPPLADQYTILLLSGVNGRVMVRRFEQGSYRELQQKLNLWESDLRLCKANGVQLLRPYKLVARLTRLLTRRKNDSKVFDRLRDELPGLTAAIITAIIGGNPLPDAVAVRALTYIRSGMLETDEEQNSAPIPDALACQWLKVWLLRKHRMEQKEEYLMEYYNQNHPDVAYHCGALMCIYASIQSLVMPNVNASIVQRYYASAIQTPAMVLGTLSRQSSHHQEKITNATLRSYYQNLLCTVHTAAGDGIPTTLNLEQQSLFALGYYQMQAELNKRRTEAKAEKNIEN